ncbi:sensor histidine kinase [Mesorhizobium sp. B2-1-5]|nr:sensor histidine kinase [Mesorhizobium sp. B2-1-5]
MIIHELATNSLKYGPLSAETGTLDVSSSAQPEGHPFEIGRKLSNHRLLGNASSATKQSLLSPSILHW